MGYRCKLEGSRVYDSGFKVGFEAWDLGSRR